MTPRLCCALALPCDVVCAKFKSPSKCDQTIGALACNDNQGLLAMAPVASWQHIRTKQRGVVGRKAFAVLTLLQLVAIPISEARAVEVSFADFPFLITCEAGGIHHAFYLSRIGQDGVAVYLTPAGQVGTITVDGTPKRVGGGGIPSSCSGKTLDQLRSAGQAYYLQR
jgi:hypothetical protein